MGSDKIFRRDAILVAVFVFITFQPYFTWYFPISLSGVATYISAIFFIKYKKPNNSPTVIILFLLYVYVSIRGGFSFLGALANLCLVPMIMTRENFLVQVFEKFRKLYSILIGISLLVFILVVFLQINLPYQILEPLNSSKEEAYYHAYPFLTVFYSYGIPLPRFCGLFDEPGVVGTISGALLVLTRFNLRDKYNILILLSGIFSASLFFIVLCLVYVLLFTKGRYKIYGAAIIAILLIIASNNEITQQLINERLVFEDGRLAGDSRSTHLSASWYTNFVHSPSFYFGLGNNAHLIHNEGGCSYKDLIIDYGIIFLVLYVLCFSIPAFLKNRIYDFFIFATTFSCIIYQRPFITTVGYVFLLVAAMYPAKTINNERSKLIEE